MPVRPKAKARPWMAKEKSKPFQRNNPNTDFYNSRAWRKVSKTYLQGHPFCECEQCKMLPMPLPSEVTDHIIPINQGGDPWDVNNFQAMNSRCHNRKSAREAHK